VTSPELGLQTATGRFMKRAADVTSTFSSARLTTSSGRSPTGSATSSSAPLGARRASPMSALPRAERALLRLRPPADAPAGGSTSGDRAPGLSVRAYRNLDDSTASTIRASATVADGREHAILFGHYLGFCRAWHRRRFAGRGSMRALRPTSTVDSQHFAAMRKREATGAARAFVPELKRQARTPALRGKERKARELRGRASNPHYVSAGLVPATHGLLVLFFRGRQDRVFHVGRFMAAPKDVRGWTSPATRRM
jgi:hypothetical protein